MGPRIYYSKKGCNNLKKLFVPYQRDLPNTGHHSWLKFLGLLQVPSGLVGKPIIALLHTVFAYIITVSSSTHISLVH